MFHSLYLSLNSIVVIALAFHLGGLGFKSRLRQGPGFKSRLRQLTFSPIPAFVTKPLLNSLSILAPQNVWCVMQRAIH